MSFAIFLKRLEKLTIDNSPAILTALGVTGTLTTAYLTGKATLRAADLIEHELPRNHEFKDEVKLVWKIYIPPATSAAFTICAIIGANRISNRRAAAIATAYSISERAFSEYKEKVIEKVGEKKERAFRDELAQDRVDANPPTDNTVIITDNGDVLCYDQFTGRYFKSSMEALKRAENEINHQIIHDGYASVSDLYYILGLPITAFSDEVGWNQDRMLEIVYSTTLSPDNKPCIAIDFDLHPTRKFSHFAGE